MEMKNIFEGAKFGDKFKTRDGGIDMKTYWVEYNFSYDYKCNDDLEHIEDFDSGRFCCLKKDIKKKIQEEIMSDFDGNESNLKIEITDCYETTEYEV